MPRVSTVMALATVSLLALAATTPALAYDYGVSRDVTTTRTATVKLQNRLDLESLLGSGEDNRNQPVELESGATRTTVEPPPQDDILVDGERVPVIGYRRYKSIAEGCITLPNQTMTQQDRNDHAIAAQEEAERIIKEYGPAGEKAIAVVNEEFRTQKQCGSSMADPRQASFDGSNNPRRSVRTGDNTDSATALATGVPIRDEQYGINRSEKARRDFDTAYDNRDWDTAISVAGEFDTNMQDAQFDFMFGCENVANMWRAAEAYGERFIAEQRTSDQAMAFNHYFYIVDRCADQREHIGTIARARPYVSAQQFERIVTRAKERWPNDQAFIAKVDEVSGRSADGSYEDPYAPIYTEARYNEVTPQMLTEYEQQANDALAKGETDKAEAIAWYYYNQRDYKQAGKWFEKAAEVNPSQSVKEGIALTDALLGNFKEAEKAAYENRNNSKAAAELYTNIGRTILSRDSALKAMDAGFTGRFEEHVKATQSVDGAVSLGWHYFAKKDYKTARSWFTFAEGLKRTDKGCEGLALSQRALKDNAGYKATSKYCSARSPELKRLFDNLNRTGARGRSSRPAAPAYKATDISKATRAYLEGDFSRCLNELNKHVDHKSYDVGVSLQRGWCTLGLKRPTEAIALFNEAATLPTNDPRQVEVDTAFGRSLALLQKGLIDEAMRNAKYYRLDQKTLSELRAEALTQRANLAFNAGSYEDALRFLEHRAAVAPLRRDLLIMQAWALYHKGEIQESARIFAMLDRQMRSPETEEGLRVLGRAARKIYYD
ncbi:MAG: hypothetical protein Alpg2KO_19190 [Alphaproteobacteria bacterium]